MDLNEKIDYEFQCFYLDQMRTSKENIFAHSREIELKKKLYEELTVLAANNEDAGMGRMLLAQNNLLESFYGFLTDLQKQGGAASLAEAAERWLAFLAGQKRSPHA